MKCPECGNDLREGAQFCASCGAKIAQEDAQDPAETVGSEVASEDVPSTSDDGQKAEPEKTPEESGAEETEASPDASEQESGKADSSDSTDDSNGKKKPPIKIIVIVAVVVVAIIAGICIFNNVQEQNRIAEEERIATEAEAAEAAQAAIDAVNETRVKQDVEADKSLLTGKASNKFVDDDPYKVTGVTIASKDVADDQIDIKFEYVIENKFFEQTSAAQATYTLEDGEWVLKGISIEGEPKVLALKGISKTDKGAVSEKNVDFHIRTQSCEVKTPDPSDASKLLVESYQFKNNAWTLVSSETTDAPASSQSAEKSSGSAQAASTADPSALEGEYYDSREKDKKGAYYSKFIIKDVDPETGEANVEFTWVSEVLASNALGSDRDHVSGTVSGTIKVENGKVTMVFGSFNNHPEPIKGTVTLNQDGSIAVAAKVYTYKYTGRTKDAQMETYDITVTDPTTGTVKLTRK